MHYLTIDYWKNDDLHTHAVMKMNLESRDESLGEIEERLTRENDWYACNVYDEDLNVTKIVSSEPYDKYSVGTGVTECGWSDRHPYEIIEIKSNCTIVVRSLRARRVDDNGMSDRQDYHYYRDYEGCVKTLRRCRRRNQRHLWMELGHPHGNVYSIGTASRYYDYSF